MAMIDVTHLNARLLLVGNGVGESIFCKPGEVAVEQLRPILGQSLGKRLPGVRVIARNVLACELFDGPGRNGIRVQLHFRKRVSSPCGLIGTRETDEHCQYGAEANIPAHYGVPPMRSSLPRATPEATEIVASPFTGISTCATPRLIGASTVVLPLAST